MDKQNVDINSPRLVRLRDRIGISTSRESHEALQHLTWTIPDHVEQIEEALKIAEDRLN